MARKKTTTGPNDANEAGDDGGWKLFEELLASKRARIIYVYGPPGVGKTYAAYRKGRIRKGVYCITVTEDSPSAELRGHYIPQESGMRWVDGPFTRAMREGARLVVNEITHASPEALTFLHPVLEGEGTSQITLPTNETVRAATGFHCVITDNHPPEELPEALRDRFDCAIEITQPHPEALARLDEDLAWAARRTANLEAERRIGLRSWLAIQKLRAELGLQRAFEAVLGRERGRRVFEDLKLGERFGEKEEG